MTRQLDFSNQDLRNRSFKGQNLAGANFQKADIRGCNFSKANLDGADFSGAIAGQSRKQILISGLFVVVFTVGFVFTLAGAVVGKFAVAVTFAFVLGGSSMIDITGAFRNGINFAVGALVALGFGIAILFTGTVAEFSNGNLIGGIFYFLIAIVFFGISYSALRISLKDIKNATGTSFNTAILISAKFTGATLKNCDFVFARLNNTEWTHAHIRQCNFSDNLFYPAVQKLCASRIGENEDFSSIDLSSLNLTRVNLSGANLASAKLNGTDLSEASLENANLSNVQAIQTNFTHTNLTGACIENWVITSETIFTDVICSHVYLDSNQKERKPASGSFEEGDFEKLVHQFTKTLDFLFRNGIDPQAFDFALQHLKNKYPDVKISMNTIENIGDVGTQIKLNKSDNAPTEEMHDQGFRAYEAMRQQLEFTRNKVWELQQKLYHLDSENKNLENKLERSELEKQLAVAKAKLEERPTSQDLQNLLYHQANQRLLYAPHSTFTDTMTDKSIQSGGGDISYVGRDNKGVSGKDQQGVAGRDISGTVTNTIQQLRETNQPEAPQLSDLLEQLQKAVESSSELGEPEKQKALEYLNQIGEMSARDPSQKKGMLPILLDAFTGVISRAANLIDPVKKIAAAILSIWQA
jgi:uncharacterized protein YjbI with pentapeptide repeats